MTSGDADEVVPEDIDGYTHEARRRLHDRFRAWGEDVLAFDVHALIDALDLRRLEWLQIISAAYQDHFRAQGGELPVILAVLEGHPMADEIRRIIAESGRIG